jgi:hypothetical protein
MNLQEYFTSQNTENETCKQGEAPTSVSPKNRFEIDVTDTDYNVKEELECQSEFSEVLEDTQTFQTPMTNLYVSALWPKICDREVINHLILYGPQKVQLTNYPEDESG